MREIIRTALACCWLSVAVGGEAANPIPKSQEDSKIVGNPAAQELFEQWAKHSPPSDRVSVSFLRRTYDRIFHVETLGSGKLKFSSPEQWSMGAKPVAITPAMLAARSKANARIKRGRDDRPYHLESMLPQVLIRSGDSLLICDEDLWNITMLDIPDCPSPEEIDELPFWQRFGLLLSCAQDLPPLLFLRQPGQIQDSCNIELLENPNSPDGQLHLRLDPKSNWHQSCWISSELIVDTTTWRPRHARIIDSSGTKEDVYSFHDWEK